MSGASGQLALLTPDQHIEIGHQARLLLIKRAAERKDILEWGRLLFPEKFTLPFCRELHEYLISIRHKEKTNTEAPRNHAKTTIKCFLVPIFQALEEPDTFRHYLNVQATGEKALAVNTAIKHELETNEDLYAIYGNVIGDRWTDGKFVLQHKDPTNTRRILHTVVFSAIGAGQSIRGLNYNNLRPDYIIVDDLYDEEDIENPESTMKKNKWFWGSLYPARAKTRRCSIHLQGTAINDEDLLEKIKKKEGWECKTFRAIKDDGSILWLELNTNASLAQERSDMGSIIFDRELMNVRRNDATSIIKRSYLTNWEYDPRDLLIKLEKDFKTFGLVGVRMGNDPSIGKDTDDDDTGTAVVSKTTWKDGTGNDYWIHEVRMERLTLEGRIQQLVELNKLLPKELPLTELFIEAISGFDDYATEVIRRTNLPVRRIKFVKDKISTLTSKSHFFENGKVHINKNIPEHIKDKLIYQLTTNTPRHDDGRDAVLLCLDSESPEWWNHI